MANLFNNQPSQTPPNLLTNSANAATQRPGNNIFGQQSGAGPFSNTGNQTNNMFQNTSQNPVTGQSTQQPINPFSNNTQTQNSFNNSQQQPNIFNNNPAQQTQQPNIFNNQQPQGTAPNNMFTNQSAQQNTSQPVNPFSTSIQAPQQTQPASATANIFNNNQLATTTNSSVNILNNQTQQTTTQTPNLFNNAMTQQAQAQGLTQPQNQPKPASDILNNTGGSATANTTSGANLFNNTQQTNTNIFNNQPAHTATTTQSNSQTVTPQTTSPVSQPVPAQPTTQTTQNAAPQILMDIDPSMSIGQLLVDSKIRLLSSAQNIQRQIEFMQDIQAQKQHIELLTDNFDKVSNDIEGSDIKFNALMDAIEYRQNNLLSKLRGMGRQGYSPDLSSQNTLQSLCQSLKVAQQSIREFDAEFKPDPMTEYVNRIFESLKDIQDDVRKMDSQIDTVIKSTLYYEPR